MQPVPGSYSANCFLFPAFFNERNMESWSDFLFGENISFCLFEVLGIFYYLIKYKLNHTSLRAIFKRVIIP